MIMTRSTKDRCRTSASLVLPGGGEAGGGGPLHHDRTKMKTLLLSHRHGKIYPGKLLHLMSKKTRALNAKKRPEQSSGAAYGGRRGLAQERGAETRKSRERGEEETGAGDEQRNEGENV